MSYTKLYHVVSGNRYRNELKTFFERLKKSRLSGSVMERLFTAGQRPAVMKIKPFGLKVNVISTLDSGYLFFMPEDKTKL